MAQSFNKGDNLVATNISTGESITFICPADKMCNQMLTRYIVMNKDAPRAKYIFIKQ